MSNVRVFGVVAAVAVVLLVGVSFLPSSDAPQPAERPSYEALQAVLAQGDGKGLDEGVIDLLQIHSPLPTAWIWVEDSTSDGEGIEHWAMHPNFVPIDPEDPDTTPEYVYVENYVPEDLEAFLDWIVQRSSHVTSPDDLTVETVVVGP